MNRSDDVLLADDPLIGRLRSLRPEAPASLVDPDAPGNRVTLQSILGDHGSVGDHGDGEDLGVTAGGAGRRRARWPRVAAVAAAVAGLVVVSTLGDTEQSAASLVRSAAAASQEALASGKAAVTVTVDGVESTYDYQFAGDDVAVEIVLGADDSVPYPGASSTVRCTGASATRRRAGGSTTTAESRCSPIGPAIRGRCWPAWSPEPASRSWATIPGTGAGSRTCGRRLRTPSTSPS